MILALGRYLMFDSLTLRVVPQDKWRRFQTWRRRNTPWAVGLHRPCTLFLTRMSYSQHGSFQKSGALIWTQGTARSVRTPIKGPPISGNSHVYVFAFLIGQNNSQMGKSSQNPPGHPSSSFVRSGHLGTLLCRVSELRGRRS